MVGKKEPEIIIELLYKIGDHIKVIIRELIQIIIDIVKLVILIIQYLIGKFWGRKEESKEEPLLPQPPEPKDYVYLSSLKELFKKFGIEEKNEESFYQLREKMVEEGKNYVKREFQKIINNEELNNNEKAQRICEKYDDLIKNIEEISKKETEFKWARDDEKSPKIYYTSVRSYLAELNLLESAEKDLKQVMPKVFQRIYKLGLETILDKVKPNVEYLEKYIENNDKKEIDQEIKRIKQKIK